MVFYQVHNPMQAAVYGPAMRVLVAEIRAPWTLLVFGHMERMADQLADAFVFDR